MSQLTVFTKSWRIGTSRPTTLQSIKLAKEFGAHVEAEWLGYSVEVAGEFYVRASAADFEKAAGGVKTARKTSQQGANSTRTDPHRNCGAAKNPEEFNIPRGSGKALAPPVGLETPQISAENERPPKNGAKSGALDPHLARVIAGWEKLDEMARTVILRIIDGTATV